LYNKVHYDTMRRGWHVTKRTIVGGVFVVGLLILFAGLVLRHPTLEQQTGPVVSAQPAAATDVQPGFLYGRVTAVDGDTYEGRLRWGGDQEAFWDDSFNGRKDENRWAVHAPGQRAGNGRGPIEIFGFKIGDQDRSMSRPFMARFGDIARIETEFRLVNVTLKSGTVLKLDRFAAGDIDDGVRVWDRKRGVVDLDTRQIRTIELLPTAPLVAAPTRLHGTVHTRRGDFTGFIQWDRQDCVGADELEGRSADGERRVRYDTIRSIARRSRDSVLVTLLDGRELALSDSREVGPNNRGINVDDRRYGRVLISWDTFERVDFSPGGSGPAYSDFRPGQRLSGRVTTRDGRRLAGRLVYDFDESETTEMLDASSHGIDYSLPFELIASIVPRRGDASSGERAIVTLRDGEELHLAPTGDLGNGNAGLLIFVDGRELPEYVRWADVDQVDLDQAPDTHR
jgi:hypothetical protein